MNYKTDAILRKKSRPVENIDKRILSCLKDMAETMYRANGAGLAAVQVGILKRLVVIDTGEGLLELINPEIISSSGEQFHNEGCLSIPGIYGVVKRPLEVKVKALNTEGKTVFYTGTELLARALCHEIDHLDGVLFIDKALPESLHDLNTERL